MEYEDERTVLLSLRVQNKLPEITDVTAYIQVTRTAKITLADREYKASAITSKLVSLEKLLEAEGEEALPWDELHSTVADRLAWFERLEKVGQKYDGLVEVQIDDC